LIKIVELRKIYTNIAIIFFFSTSLPAQLQPDSMVFHALNSIGPPRVYSLYEKPNDIYSTASHDALARHNHQGNFSGQTVVFYNNLYEAAQRTYITRWLHKMLVREPGQVRLPATVSLHRESEFANFKGKTIRDINFNSVSLFARDIDAPWYGQLSRLERIGKSLHVNTNERIIRNNLLFGNGDIVDPFLLADNERLLRQLPYIEDARIYVIEDEVNPDIADIYVITKDRWSRGFDMDMSEIDEGHIELYDKNILGLGQEVQANLLFDAGSEQLFGYQTLLKLNNLAGTFIQGGVNYLNGFDHNRFNIHGERRFLTPSIKYAGGIQFSSESLTGNFIYPDTTFLNQRLSYHGYDYWFGRSIQLPERNNFYNRRNIYLTSRFNRNVFFDRPEVAETARYEFHNRNLYIVSMAYTRVGYLLSKYIYGFGPTEDIPIGSKLETTFGYEDNQFYPRWYAGLAITQSSYLNNTAYLKNSISLGGFNNSGNWEQGMISFETSGFSSLFDLGNMFLRQFFTLEFTRGIRRFDDETISISHRHGIRGLRSDKLKGIQKFNMQLETMLYARNSWYGFRYAFYTLVDLGWIGPGEKFVLSENFYSGFGLGLRVRNEHLVLPTLQMRLAWFPRVPESATANWFYIMSEQRRLFDEYRVNAPDILPFR
jgi:hypothetical protein